MPVFLQLFLHVEILLINKEASAEKILTKAGINVRYGLYNDEARALNHDYMYFHEYKKPYVRLKAGMSLMEK